MRRHAKPDVERAALAARDAARPSHYARLGTERGTLPAGRVDFGLADLPPLPARTTPPPPPALPTQTPSTAAETGTSQATQISPASSASPAVPAVPGPDRAAVESSSAAQRPSVFMAEHGLDVGELLVAVLDGLVGVRTVAGSPRFCLSPLQDDSALASVRVVSAPASGPLRAGDVLVRTGCTVDELFAEVLSGRLAVHRSFGGPRFAADDVPATATATATAAATGAAAAPAAAPVAA